MATAALCSLTQGTSQENARKIVESLMVPLLSLIDDNSIATRNYALKIFMHVDALNYEQLKTLASALLSRLDDPGSEVRERAAKCLGLLKLKSDNEDEYGEMWQHLLKQILNTMLIHLESPEIDLRNALIQSIIDLSKTSPQTYRHALNESTISQELKTQLPSAG
jgi:dynein assembly factor 5, axonemal